MTSIGLEYLKHTEQQRHNARMEEEQRRANLASEKLKQTELDEKRRANLASEANTMESIAQQARNAKYAADTQAHSNRFATVSKSSDVRASNRSQEKQNTQRIDQSQRESELRAETEVNTSGLKTLTSLFNTLVSAVTHSGKKGK